MKCFVLLTVLAFASKNENDVGSFAANSGENIMENAAVNSIVVKIEEDEYVKKKSESSKYFGVHYDERTRKWVAQRWSKNEKRIFKNGYHKDEKTAAHASDTLARGLVGNGEQDHKLNFPEDNTEVHAKERTKSSNYFGVTYNEYSRYWLAQRWGKIEKKMIHNGYYKDEVTAAHASDTLTRQLIANGEEGHKLNFSDDNTEVHAKEKKSKSSKFVGITYNEKHKQWYTQRWSKRENKVLSNGYHEDEETAAHASDTLARKLVENGEQGHKLNFPDDSSEVYHKKVIRTAKSKYIGVTYNELYKQWFVQRWSKTKKKLVNNGYRKDEEAAAHASDTLARKLMARGEQNLKLNFPDDNIEICTQKYKTPKRKRSYEFDSQKDRNDFERFEKKEK